MQMNGIDDKVKYVSLRPDGTGIVPGWEGVVNPMPLYMDMAFYVLNRETRSGIRNMYKRMNHMTPIEYLQMATKFNPKTDLIVEYHGSTPEYAAEYPSIIYYVTKSYIGFVEGIVQDRSGKYSMARINWEAAERNEEIYGGMPVQQGPVDFTKDMDDMNFLLSRYAKILEPHEAVV